MPRRSPAAQSTRVRARAVACGSTAEMREVSDKMEAGCSRPPPHKPQSSRVRKRMRSVVRALRALFTSGSCYLGTRVEDLAGPLRVGSSGPGIKP
eukprot:969180-Prymnesium_polylepis.1